MPIDNPKHVTRNGNRVGTYKLFNNVYSNLKQYKVYKAISELIQNNYSNNKITVHR